MPKPIISVDIDDVLAANAASFTAFSNELWGTNLTADDYEDDWAHMWNIEYDEARKRIESYFSQDFVARYAHDAAALPVLEKLKESYDLIVVTARRMETKDYTLQWIEKYYPGIFDVDKIYFAGIWESVNGNAQHLDKGALLQQLGANYHIDDQLKHSIGAEKRGIQALLFGEYTWNRPDADFPLSIVQVKNWNDVGVYFDGLAH